MKKKGLQLRPNNMAYASAYAMPANGVAGYASASVARPLATDGLG